MSNTHLFQKAHFIPEITCKDKDTFMNKPKTPNTHDQLSSKLYKPKQCTALMFMLKTIMLTAGIFSVI